MCFALFPTHQKDISTLPSRGSENEIREKVFLVNVAVVENEAYWSHEN